MTTKLEVEKGQVRELERRLAEAVGLILSLAEEGAR